MDACRQKLRLLLHAELDCSVWNLMNVMNDLVMVWCVKSVFDEKCCTEVTQGAWDNILWEFC